MRSQPIFIIHNLNTFLCVYRSSLFAFALYGIMNVYCGDGRRRKTIFFFACQFMDEIWIRGKDLFSY